MGGGTCCWSQARMLYYDGKVAARKIKFAVTSQQRAEVLGALRRDTEFLAEHNLMDYSLLVGVKRGPRGSFDHEPVGAFRPLVVPDGNMDKALYIGIIDFLQRWDAAKVVAHYVKCLEHNKATIHPHP